MNRKSWSVAEIPQCKRGGKLDTGIGLHYFGARYYDARIGRWLTQDPLRSAWSPYSYVHNAPLTYVDLFGLSEELPGTPAGQEEWFERVRRRRQEEEARLISMGGGGSLEEALRSGSWRPGGRHTEVAAHSSVDNEVKDVYLVGGTILGVFGGPLPFGLAYDIRTGRLASDKFGRLRMVKQPLTFRINTPATAAYYSMFKTFGWFGIVLQATTFASDLSDAQSEYEMALAWGSMIGSTIGGIGGAALGSALLPGWGTFFDGLGGAWLGQKAGRGVVNFLYRR